MGCNADNLFLVSVFVREPDCVVRIMSRLRGERSGLRIHAGQGIFLFSKQSSLALWLTYPLTQWVPRLKRPGPQVNSSPPSRVEVESEWCENPTAFKSFRSVDGENFTFYLGAARIRWH